MGLSGSGKSTLVRTLIRLIEPTAGRIEIDGQDVTAASHDELLQLRRHTSSMVFQHFGLLAHRTVLDNVAFGLEVQGVSKARASCTRCRDAEARRPRGRREPVPRRALGRHAAARRPRARVRGRPEGAALRRAVQRARPADPPRHAGRGDAPAGRRPARRRSSSRTTCPRRCGSATASRSCATAAIVQLGTPEELVGSPADEYVANFVRDIPRSHVLTLRWIMREPTSGRGGRAEARRGDDRAERRARDRVERAAVLRRRRRPDRRRRRQGRRAHGDRRRGRVLVTASTIAASPGRHPRASAVVAEPHHDRRRDRRRDGRSATSRCRARCRWPELARRGTRSATTSTTCRTGSLPRAHKAHPNFAYRLIHWISSGLDALVRWLYHLLSKWLTWPGTTVLGGLLALRFGGRRAAAIMVASFASFAALGLWDESMQTLALMLVAVALSLLVGVPLGVARRPLRPLQPADHAACSTRCRSSRRSPT